MSRRKAEMILELVDRATRPARQFMATQQRLAKSVETSNKMATRGSQAAARAASRTERTISALGRSAKASFVAIASGAKKSATAIKALHHQTIRLGKYGVSQIAKGWARAKGGLLAGAAAITIAYGAAAAAAGGFVGTASDFEKFQTILTTTEGSAEAAKAAMSWVQNFAVKTPYELDQVTDAFVMLRAYGLDPTQGLLLTLGDTSAAMGKPLSQAVEAIADAVTGENERLKEFGIKASKTGNKITYEYTNAAGKTVRATVKATDRIAIQQKLMSIMNEKYAGSMDRLSKTWEGMTSNILDQWTKFTMMIMNAGLFDWMKSKLEAILEQINQMEADGRLQIWAENIGTTIQNALVNMWEFGSAAVSFFIELQQYLSAASEYVGGWSNLAAILAGIAFAPTLISTAAGLVQIGYGLAALSTALWANPIVLAIGAIAGGVYLIYKNWDTVGPYFEMLWDWIKVGFEYAWAIIKAAFDWSPIGLIVNNWEPISNALSNPLELGQAAIEAAWDVIKFLFKWSPIGLIVENWGPISDTLSGLFSSGLEASSAAFDAGMQSFSDFASASWQTIQSIFDAIVSGAKVLGDAVAGALNAAVSGAQAALSIVTGSSGIDRIFDQLGGIAERGFGADFVQGQALSEALAAGQISLDGYRKSLESISNQGGEFATTAREMIEVSKQLDGFSLPSPTMPAASDIEATTHQLAQVSQTAAKVQNEVQFALSQAQRTIATANFKDQGAQLMQGLADGIRSKISIIAAAAAAVTEAIRSALPRSASLSFNAPPQNIQARASGGAFNRGWLLTGENGPELEYKNRGGFIAHNRALQNMVTMSKAAVRNSAEALPNYVKGAAIASAVASGAVADGPPPSLASKYLTERNSPTNTSGDVNITMTFTGKVDRDVLPDLEKMKEALLREITTELDRAARAARRREHS